MRYFFVIVWKFYEINYMKNNEIIGFDDGHQANKNEQHGLLIFNEFLRLHHILIMAFSMQFS